MSDDDTATQAFEAVRAEVALLRRAVERLAAERADQVDYSPTLGVISKNLLATGRRVDTLSQSPLLSLTPAAVGAQVEAIAANARQSEHKAVAAARSGLDEAARALAARVASARTHDAQGYWLIATAAAGLVAGMLAFVLITGPIARTVPASWQWPEKVAANAMALPMWDAGARMMMTASPEGWNGIALDYSLVEANRGTVAACRKAAARAGKPVRCGVKVAP